MFSKDQILKPYRFNLKYAYDLVSDVDDDQMYFTPSPGLENHPGFTLGHLVTGSVLVADDLGVDCSWPEGWDEFFLRKGPGDPRLPVSDAPNLPSKEVLLRELDEKHRIVEQSILALDDAKFAEPCKWRYESYFPTEGDMLMFMCVTHEAMHLAQVAAWRRAMGLPSSLARL